MKAILPLTLAPPGKKGINPKKLLIKIKKKIVNKNGKYLPAFFAPILGMATSSLTNKMIGSINDCKPLGAEVIPLFLYAAAEDNNSSNKTKTDTNKLATFFVIDKSQSCLFASLSIFSLASTIFNLPSINL